MCMDQARKPFYALIQLVRPGSCPTYFQGDGGTGPPPPFFQGDGGTGPPPPLAIITESSPCVTTTVFRLIAPTNTSMARKTTVSLRDIVPPRDKTTRETVYLLIHQCQAAQAMSLFRIDTYLPFPSFR